MKRSDLNRVAQSESNVASPSLDRRALIVGSLASLVAACGGSSSADSVQMADPPAVPPPPEPASLTVMEGVQTATQSADATTDIFANADPAESVFDRWTGDVELLLNANERQTGALAPTGAQIVTATYRSQSAYTYTQLLVRGTAGSPAAVTALYYFAQPLPAAGVVFRFHGSGGSSRGVTSGSDDEKVNRDLVADGYAIVALDSNDRAAKQWDNLTADPAVNVDMANVSFVLATLTSLGLVDANTRYFSIGHSNGGAFAPLAAFQLGWHRCYVSCARGNQPQLQAVTTVPTFWTIAANDTTIGADGNAGAQANFQTLSGRGIAAQFITLIPSAVYPSRFTQIMGISATDSQTIFQSLKDSAFLDADNFLVSAPSDAALAAIPSTYAAYEQEIGNLLRVAYAEHQFSAATSARLRAFFAAS